MLRLAFAALLLLAASAAHAQVQSVPWAREQPTAAHYRDVYPPLALSEGREGEVRLICTITDERKLACDVRSETPEGYGFGEAALALSRRYVVRGENEDARLVAGARVVVPISFRLAN